MDIRIATKDDIEGIKNLLDDLNRSSVEFLPNFFRITATTTEEVTNIMENHNSDIIIATDKDGVIGLCKLDYKVTKNLAVLHQYAYVYIQNFIVNEQYRRRGVGKALIDATKKWGKERGAKHFRLSVIPTNQAAIDFYIGEGFEPYMLNMEMKL